MPNPKTLPAHLRREIAAAAQADERTVTNILNGRRVRGAVADRVAAALRDRLPTLSPPLAALSSTPKTLA